MRHFKPRSHQHGTVLVVGLLLLLVITIVAVASMANTHMQERMAGNARTQALAFEVASGGVPGSIAVFDSRRQALEDQCASDPANWDDPNPIIVPSDTPTEIGPHTVRLTRLAYCIDAQAEGIQPQNFVLNIGEVLSGSEVIARRAIEVRLIKGSPTGQPDCGALCFPGCADGDTYDFGRSDSLKIDGDGNPAITAQCPEKVRDGIFRDRIVNFDGGVSGVGAEPLAWPWDSPASINKFRLNILDAMGAGSPGSPPVDITTVISGETTLLAGPAPDWEFIEPPIGTTYTDNGNTTYGSREDPENPGSTDSPQITYIAGNAKMGGTVSGAGILIVEGTLEWAGTPNFDGLILVLGGGFQAGGGGGGGNFGGSLVVVNIWDPYKGYDKSDIGTGVRNDFGPVNVNFIGGGTALYRYDCDYLAGLSTDLQLGDWDPQCGAGEAGTGETLTRIASWRESLGWRGDDWIAPPGE